MAQIVHAFETLGVEYVVGGSLASSVYGIPRATQDVDLVAKMNAAHAEPLARLLKSDHVCVAADRECEGFRRAEPDIHPDVLALDPQEVVVLERSGRVRPRRATS